MQKPCQEWQELCFPIQQALIKTGSWEIVGKTVWSMDDRTQMHGFLMALCIENRWLLWVTYFSETFLSKSKVDSHSPTNTSIVQEKVVHTVKFTFHWSPPPPLYRLPGAVGDVNPAFFLGRVPGTQKVAWRWFCQAPGTTKGLRQIAWVPLGPFGEKDFSLELYRAIPISLTVTLEL